MGVPLQTSARFEVERCVALQTVSLAIVSGHADLLIVSQYSFHDNVQYDDVDDVVDDDADCRHAHVHDAVFYTCITFAGDVRCPSAGRGCLSALFRKPMCCLQLFC